MGDMYNRGGGALTTTSLTTTSDVEIGGDLTVSGTTTTIETTNTVISDKLIELANGTSTGADSGIIIERGSTGNNAAIIWDESDDTFVVGTTTATGASTGDLSITDGALKAGSLDISGNIDVDGITNLDAVDIDGAVQLDATLTVGANDQGYDVILYGNTASANLTWSTANDDLIANGATRIVVPDGQLVLASTAVSSTAAELNLLDGKSFVDEDNMASDSATAIASQQSIKAYVDATVTSQDLDATGDSGTIAIDLDSETLTIAGGTGATTVGSGNGITVNVDAAQAGITSVINASLVAGRDADNQINFGTDNEIIFRVNGGDGVTMKASGEIEAASLDISGDADIDGILEADTITVGGVALNTVIAGVTVTNATNSAHVLVTDNENANEENLITFVEGATDGTGNVGLEMDGHLTYNPSTGTVTSAVFKGNIDAVDGDFDGTLEADAITVGGTNIVTGSLITTLGTVSAGVWNGTAIASADLDADTAHLTTNQTLSGEKTFTADLVVTTANHSVTVDVSADEMILAGDTKLSFNDASGGENISADASGTLVVNAGTILDAVAPTIDLNASTKVIVNSPLMQMFSGTTAKPIISLECTNPDALGGTFQFVKNGSSVADNDVIGTIKFVSEDDGSAVHTYATIESTIADMTAGSEGGSISIRVASHDGELQPGLTLQDGNAEDEIDVFIANGTASVTTVAGDLTVNGDTTLFTSANSQDPLVQIKNTTNDANGARLQLVKDKGANAADNDVVGVIEFVGDNDAQQQTSLAKIQTEVADASDGAEGGRLLFGVATHDGEMQFGLVIEDGDVEDEIDVITGNGTLSTTTAAGYSKATSGFLIPEAKSIHIETPLLATADHTANGITTLLTASETIAVGNLVYVSGNGTIGVSDADAVAKMPAFGIAVTGGDANASLVVLLQGTYRDDTYNFTAGNRLFVHTDGTATATAPSGSSDVVQAIGVALNADVIYFSPDMTLVEIS